MIPIRDKASEFTSKQESSTSTTHDGSKSSNNASSSSTNSWSRLKDPRIVRVSRVFGGKDRHSKVCTVRGLRDRRVRLSVPTAIQLYDLQDRLGLNQPSKVVDWLLNAAKHEIDELPPLQIPQGSLIYQNLQPFLDSQSAKQGLKISDSINRLNEARDDWGKSKNMFPGETSDRREDNWARSDQEFQEHHHQDAYNNFSSHNFLSKQNNNPNSITNLLNSSNFPYNSFVRWDPSSLTLPHQNSSPNSSLLPSGISTQPYFPSHIPPTDSDFTHKQLHFQSTSNSPSNTSHVYSTSQPVRPFHFGMTADLLPRNDENKDNEFL